MSEEASEPRGELRIGDVAKLAGTTPRTIRYYEEIGLLPVSGGREPGAHRTYATDDVDRLTELLRLRTLLGVSLDGLKDLVEAEDNARRAAPRVARRCRRPGAAPSDPRVARRPRRAPAGAGAARRDEIAALEAELVARRRRVREL